jgi:hypothetical protein
MDSPQPGKNTTTAVRWRESFGYVAAAETEKEAEKALRELTS